MAWIHKFHRVRKRAGSPSFPADRPMKLVLVGDPGVGKSRIYCRLYHHGEAGTEDVHDRHQAVPPVEVETEHMPDRHQAATPHSLQFPVAGEEWHVDVHDTMSTEDFDRLRPLVYPCTDLFLVVMSAVDQQSARNIVHKWVPEIGHHCRTTPFIILCTKTDLLEHTPQYGADSQQNGPQTQQNGQQSKPNKTKFSLKTLFQRKSKENAFSLDDTSPWTLEKGKELARMTKALANVVCNDYESTEAAIMDILETYRHYEKNRIVPCR